MTGLEIKLRHLRLWDLFDVVAEDAACGHHAQQQSVAGAPDRIRPTRSAKFGRDPIMPAIHMAPMDGLGTLSVAGGQGPSWVCIGCMRAGKHAGLCSPNAPNKKCNSSIIGY
jgi:hypothetical protein